jgi:hypothetical protein
MMREEDFHQQTAFVWGVLWGTPAQATLVKVMQMLDSTIDIAEANSSKMKVSQLGKKVNFDKLFKMARSKNSNVPPWHVATVWLSLHGTKEEKSIVDTWMIVDPLMTNEYANRSTKKVTRLVEAQGLDFFKIWLIATCVEEEPSKSGYILSSNSDKVYVSDNPSSTNDAKASNSNNPSITNDAKASNSNESSSSKNNNNSNNNTASDTINPSKNDEVLHLSRVADFFQQAALIWWALQGTSAELTTTDTMLWMDPAMNRSEANNSKMKVSRLE